MSTETERQQFEAAAKKVKAKRTAWLESHGVPISHEFAEFAEAIGELTDLADSTPSIRMIKRATGRTIPDLTKQEHVCEWQSTVRAEQSESPRSGKYPIDRPCSACSAGDSAMEYHDHEPPFRAGHGGESPRSAPVEVRKCLEAAVKLAFMRHNIEPEEDTATIDEIAADAAGACFGEECCDDKPIPELVAVLDLMAESPRSVEPDQCVVCGADLLPREMPPPHCEDCQLEEEHWHEADKSLNSVVQGASPESVEPIFLNSAQHKEIEDWAAMPNNRWADMPARRFNLATFARSILKTVVQGASPTPEQPADKVLPPHVVSIFNEQERQKAWEAGRVAAAQACQDLINNRPTTARGLLIAKECKIAIEGLSYPGPSSPKAAPTTRIDFSGSSSWRDVKESPEPTQEKSETPKEAK